MCEGKWSEKEVSQRERDLGSVEVPACSTQRSTLREDQWKGTRTARAHSLWIHGLMGVKIKTWTIKNNKNKLWCWRRLLRVTWTARRSNQSILKEINSEYSLEGLLLKLKLQYFGHLIWRVDSLEKSPMLRKIEAKRRRGWQRMRWLDHIINSMDMNLSKLWDIEKERGAWCAAGRGVTKSWTLSDWITTKPIMW